MQESQTDNESSTTPQPYRNKPIRFLILLLLAFVVFANLYTFNNPQALQYTIQQQLQIGQSKFNMLYTIIALPNIVFAALIGVFLDYFGVRRSLVLMAIGVMLSQVLVGFGGVYRSYEMMLVGRFFFGFFQQSMSIAQQCYVTSWFLGKEIGMALGLAVTLPQFGSALNSFLTPYIYEKTHKLGPPLFTSVGILGISLICILIVTYLDIKADQQDKKNNVKLITDLDKQQQVNQTIKLSDLKVLKWTFWLICLLCTFSIAEYIPFLDNVNQLLQQRFCFSQLTAGKNVTITYIVVGLFGFPIGWLVDQVGYRRYFCFFGMIIFTLGHGIILIYPQCMDSSVISSWSGASYGLFLLGVGYCLYANCLIPSIPLVVSQRVLGTAFGITEMFQNIAMGVYPIISGVILQDAKTPQLGYRHTSLFYFVTGLFSVFLSTFLFFINKKDQNKLDASCKHKFVKAISLIKMSSDTEHYRRSDPHINHDLGYKTDYSDYIQDKQKPPLRKFQMQLSNQPIKKKQKQIDQKKKRKSQKGLQQQKQFIQDGYVSFQQELNKKQQKEKKQKMKQQEKQKKQALKLKKKQSLRRLQSLKSYQQIYY